MALMFASSTHIYKKEGRIASLLDVDFDENHGFASRIAPESGSDVTRRRAIRIDLSKGLWHDAARMSLKETFARDGFVDV